MLIIVGGFAVAGAIALFGKKRRRERAAFTDENDRINRLPLEQARSMAHAVLENPLIFEPSRASSPFRTAENIGQITREFFETYERVASVNGAVVLDRDEVRGSGHDLRLARIGRSDYVDVVTRWPEDTVLEVDGSERAEDAHTSYPSVYHWIVGVALDLAPGEVRDQRWSRLPGRR